MAKRRFEQVVEAYLSNSASPGDLLWLRTQISLDDESRLVFLKKCRQHQATQYFMVQQTLPSGWGGLDESDLAEETVHKTDSNEAVASPQKELGRGSKRKSTHGLRSVFEFAFISGLACVTIVVGLAWLDRARLFRPESSPSTSHLDRGFNESQSSEPYETVHIKIPRNSPSDEGGASGDQHYMSARHLEWYLRLDETPSQGQWSDIPSDYGIDFERLDQLQKRSLYSPNEFPHSFLDPDFMLEKPSSPQSFKVSSDS